MSTVSAWEAEVAWTGTAKAAASFLIARVIVATRGSPVLTPRNHTARCNATGCSKIFAGRVLIFVFKGVSCLKAALSNSRQPVVTGLGLKPAPRAVIETHNDKP